MIYQFSECVFCCCWKIFIIVEDLSMVFSFFTSFCVSTWLSDWIIYLLFFYKKKKHYYYYGWLPLVWLSLSHRFYFCLIVSLSCLLNLESILTIKKHVILFAYALYTNFAKLKWKHVVSRFRAIYAKINWTFKRFLSMKNGLLSDICCCCCNNTI